MSFRAVVVISIVSSVASAQSFLRTLANTTGEQTICVTWSDRTFDYRVDSAGSVRTPLDTEFTAIDAAFTTWQAVADGCSDFIFKRGMRLVGGTIGKGTESENLIIFREIDCREAVPESDPCLSDGSCGNVHRCWDHSMGTIGLTTVTYSTRTGVAVDADIELNAGGFLMTTISSPPCELGRETVQCVAYDVQNTLTHEIGHAVGFDHVSDSSSTMAPTAPLGETSKRVLDVGTASGFCQTYPRGLPPTACDELATLQSRIIASTSSSCASAPLPVAALVLLMFFRRRNSSAD